MNTHTSSLLSLVFHEHLIKYLRHSNQLVKGLIVAKSYHELEQVSHIEQELAAAEYLVALPDAVDALLAHAAEADHVQI